jgi:hypothetical protein
LVRVVRRKHMSTSRREVVMAIMGQTLCLTHWQVLAVAMGQARLELASLPVLAVLAVLVAVVLAQMFRRLAQEGQEQVIRDMQVEPDKIMLNLSVVAAVVVPVRLVR